MSYILVSGFEPFGGEKINPSLEMIRAIEGMPNVKGVLLPTSYRRSMEVIQYHLETLKPAAVLSLGQAGGRCALTLEKVAINWMDAAIADNDGVILHDQIIEAEGPAAYFSTMDVKGLAEACCAHSSPAAVSLSAGSFICNRVLYGVCHWAAKNRPEMKTGFMHVPYLPQQVVEKPGQPSMALETMVEGLTVILDILVKESE